MFDGSQGVKLRLPGVSSCLKTRLLHPSCPLLLSFSAADMKWCCLNLCCRPEWTWIWANSYLDAHFLLFTPHCSAFTHRPTHPTTVWGEIKKLGIKDRGDKVFFLPMILDHHGAHHVCLNICNHWDVRGKDGQCKDCVHRREAARGTLCWLGLNQSAYSWGQKVRGSPKFWLDPWEPDGAWGQGGSGGLPRSGLGNFILQ